VTEVELELEEDSNTRVKFMLHHKLFIGASDDWSGDSYAGFGASCEVMLSREQAQHLCTWLTEKLAAPYEPLPRATFGYNEDSG